MAVAHDLRIPQQMYGVNMVLKWIYSYYDSGHTTILDLTPHRLMIQAVGVSHPATVKDVTTINETGKAGYGFQN